MKIGGYLKSCSLRFGSPDNQVCFQAQNILGNKKMTGRRNLAKFVSPGLMCVSHRLPGIFPRQRKFLLLSRICRRVASV